MGLFSFNFASNFGGVLVSLFGRYTKYKKIIKSKLCFTQAKLHNAEHYSTNVIISKMVNTIVFYNLHIKHKYNTKN